MNYGNAIGGGDVAAQGNYGAEMRLKDAVVSRTIGQNIDAQIASLKAEIERLQGVKAQLASGASLLDVRMEDLRRAMQY